VSDFNSVKNRVVWVDIPVADLDRSAAFYAAVMGIKVSKQSFGAKTPIAF
jgi:predicted enzyme related to lactoylglutathione lyase